MSVDVVTVPDAQHHADCQMVYPQLPLVYGHTVQDCLDLLPPSSTTTVPPVPTTDCWAAIPPRGDCTGTNPYVNGAYPTTPTTAPVVAPEPSTEAPAVTIAPQPVQVTGPPRTHTVVSRPSTHQLPATGSNLTIGSVGGSVLALGAVLVCLTRWCARAA